MRCKLCQSEAAALILQLKNAEYYRCEICDLVFLSEAFHLSPQEEELRYLSHENDVNDKDYQAFVGPLKQVILERSPPCEALDFGSGTGPVLGHLLEREGFAVRYYDPFFSNHPALLERKYPLVYACEVVEHFRDVDREFKMIHKLLAGGGLFALMTHFFDEAEDFENWYYRKDPTHISFYSPNCLRWIQKSYGFSHLEILGPRIAVLWR